MKKLLSIIMAVMMMLSLPVNAYASDTDGDWQDVVMTDEEFESILELGNGEDLTNTRASNLINTYSLAIKIDTSISTIYVAGRTYGTTEVVKSGFKNIVLERRKNSSESWAEYKRYGDELYDTFASNLQKEITVAPGYYYRITLKHYAKKNIFVKQTIKNSSNAVHFK